MDENHINFFISENLRKIKLADYKKIYLGTFANDEIFSNKLKIDILAKPYNFCFICNSLTRANDRGTGHWLLISIHFSPILKKMDVKFMDSFALPYRNYGAISKYIDNIRKICYLNNISFVLETLPKPLQDANSEICGGYACFVVLKQGTLKSVSLRKMFASFKPSCSKENDLKIAQFIRKYWPVRTCTSNKNSNIKQPTFSWNKRMGIMPSFCPKKVYNDSKCLPSCTC